MQLINLAILAGAMGAVAHPSHMHLHRAAHEQRDNVHYKAIHKTVYKTVTPTPTSTPVAVPTTSSVAAVVPTPASSSAAAASPSSGSSSKGKYIPFCGGNTKRATLAEIKYAGNIGTSSNYGCNMMVVPEDIVDMYDYSTAYKNVANEPYQVICFNKIGPTGEVNGFYGYEPVKFMLAPGETKHVVFEANSQGSCAFAPNQVPKDPYGAWAGAWVEFDFENSSNNKWSGADCSTLVTQAAGMPFPGCQVCVGGGGTCSAVLSNGQGINGYVKGMEAVDGTGINHPQGKLSLIAKVGYTQ